MRRIYCQNTWKEGRLNQRSDKVECFNTQSLHLFITIGFVYTAVGVSSSVKLQRGRMFLKVKLDNSSDSLCVVDTPSSSLKVNIDKQCIISCIEIDDCYDLNIVDGGTSGGFTCQLYVAMETVQYNVRSGCVAYQVCYSTYRHRVYEMTL